MSSPRPASTSLLERADQPGLIYKPHVLRRTQTVFHLVGKRDNERVVPWGFWGGVLAAVVGVLIIGYEGMTGLWEIWDLAGSIAAIAFGVLLMRFAATTSLEDEPCAELDLATRTIRLTSSREGVALPEVRFDDLTEIVYGMTTYPLSQAKGAVRVQAFSLLIRYGTSTLIPVIEASPDKDELYGVARFLSQVTRLPITQVGLGVQR